MTDSKNSTVKVDLIYPYTDKAGKNHEAGKSADLTAGEAIELVHLGRAKYPNTTEAAKVGAVTTTKEKS